VAEVEYALAGDTNIAFRVIGRAGRVDVVVVAGALFPFELLAVDRVASRFIAGLGALGRLVVFDKRGIGLSDPITDWATDIQEQWAEDLIAVVEASGLDHPAVVSWDHWGAARSAASRRPDLFGSMALINPATTARSFRAAMTRTEAETVPTRAIEAMAFPSRIHDEEFTAWLEQSGRTGASPSTATRIWSHLLATDRELTPPGITTRTLVLHSRDCMMPEAEVRDVARGIAGASFVQVPGADVYPISGDVDPMITEIAEFVTGSPSELAPQRHVCVVVFTDLVDSTKRATKEGDSHWRELLDVHDRTVQRAVTHHGGRVIKYTGDGVLALLPSADGALSTVRVVAAELADRGLEIRAGIHVGDVDLRGDDVSGLAVNVAARIMGRASGGETFVSEAMRLASLGAGHCYEDLGTAQLKGVDELWQLYRWLG